MIRLTDYIASIDQSPLRPWVDLAPWALVTQAPAIVRQLLTELPADEYVIQDAHCIIGPGAELKTTFMFSGSKLAHFNFVGDSVLGHGINLEAGSIVANYRNERVDKEVLVRVGGQLQRTGCDKFGALLGDQCRIGANAVLAPGAVLVPASVVGRGQVFDAETS